MKVKEFIEELKQLPENATIGMLDVDDIRIYEKVYIHDNNDYVDSYIEDNVLTPVSLFVKTRRSNKDKECDYYIGYGNIAYGDTVKNDIYNLYDGYVIEKD